MNKAVPAGFPLMARMAVAAGLVLALAACSKDTGEAPAPSGAAAPADVSSATHDPATTATSWQCGPFSVTTRFDDASLEALTLAHSDQELKLRAVDASEGARFADEAGNAFWSRPGGVTLTLAGQSPVECRKAR